MSREQKDRSGTGPEPGTFGRFGRAGWLTVPPVCGQAGRRRRPDVFSRGPFCPWDKKSLPGSREPGRTTEIPGRRLPKMVEPMEQTMTDQPVQARGPATGTAADRKKRLLKTLARHSCGAGS